MLKSYCVTHAGPIVILLLLHPKCWASEAHHPASSMQTLLIREDLN